MPIAFTNPWALVLLAAVPYVIYLSRRSLADLSRWRRRVTTGLRLVIVVLLVLAVAGAQLAKRKDALCVLFVLDQSDSIPADKKRAELEWVHRAAQGLHGNDTAGAIVFGTEAFVEKPPEGRLDLAELHSAVGTSYSDVAAALRLAMGMFPEDSLKRIVLLSDGNETLGNAIEESKVAASNEVTIDCVPLEAQYDKEVLVQKLDAPSTAKLGEPFDVKLIIKAHNNAQGKIRLYRNDKYLGEQEIRLVQGDNRFEFPQQLNKAGSYTYDAVLETEDDTIAENNRGLASVIVRGQPKVLYVEGDPGEHMALARALAREKIHTTVVGASGMPTSLAELQNYDALIVSDVPAMLLSDQQMKMIQAGVRNLGVGLIMIGGEDSFGVGGYFRTPVEEALPVYMDVRKKKQYPALALELIIDKSGSMSMTGFGFSKVDLAKRAAEESVQLLNEYDWVGVICFDSAFKEIVKLRKCTDKYAIKRQIGTIRAGGGTSMYGAMERGYQRLKSVNARLRHMILLTDGQTTPGDFERLTRECAAKHITVSCVAVGSDSAQDLLKRIAKTGKGNYYYTQDPRHIPRIFTRETLLASKALVIEEPFQPLQRTGSEILKGLAAGDLPALLGYVATTPKEMAKVPLVSHQGDPVLAQWRYGLGKAVAFTSDAKRRWAAHWLQWPGYGKFWSQAVRWVIRSAITADFQTALEFNQGRIIVTADAVTDAGEFVNFLEPRAHIVTPDMGGLQVDLEQVAPGRYQAAFDARTEGAYWVNVTYKRPDGQFVQQSAGLTIPYAPEYADLAPNNFLLAQVAENTGGEYNPVPETTFTRRPEGQIKRSDIWQTLALLALLLFPVDIALRRLMIEREHLSLFAEKARALVPRRRPAERDETLGRLLDLKSDLGLTGAPTPPPPPTPPAIAGAAPAPPAPPAEAPPPSPPTATAPTTAPASGTMMQRLKAAKQRALTEREQR